MKTFFKLLQNELIKMLTKKPLWIWTLISIAMFIGLAYLGTIQLTENNNEASNLKWQQRLEVENKRSQMMLKDPRFKNSEENQIIQDSIAQNQYRLDNNIQPLEQLEIFLATSETARLFILIITTLLCSNLVTKEFSTGTINLLALRPIRRWKLLLSKYIAAFVCSALLAIILHLLIFIGGISLFEMGNLTSVVAINGVVTEISMLYTHLAVPILHTFAFIMLLYLPISFAISTVAKSSSVAQAISVLSLMILPGIFTIKIKSDYGLFENIQSLIGTIANSLRYYKNNVVDTSIISDATLSSLITISGCYIAALIAIAFVIFTRRDIAK